MAETPEKKSNFVQRGFFLFALLAAMALTLLVLMFGRSRQQPPQESVDTPLAAMMAPTPVAGFPGSLSWGALAHLSEAYPSRPGWDVRYNAAQILARRGSPETPLHILREMLDEKRQLRNQRAKTADGVDVPNESAARRVVLIGLSATLILHKKHPDTLKEIRASNTAGLQRLYDAIDRLESSSNNVIRTEARKVKLAIEEMSS